MTFPATAATTLNPQSNNAFDINAALQSLVGTSGTLLADLTSFAGLGAAPAYIARAVVTALSGTYTGSGTGVLTASAAAAFGTQDGVSTLAVGDVVLLPGAATNITATKDSGPYVITTIGTGAIKWVLTRPTWWATGATMPLAGEVSIGGEGTIFGGGVWRSFAAKATVIDTTDPQFYPHQTSVALGVNSIAGVTAANSTLYVASQAVVVPVANTATGTEGAWHMSTTTPGYPGTSSLVATSSNASDTSRVTFLVTNW